MKHPTFAKVLLGKLSSNSQSLILKGIQARVFILKIIELEKMGCTQGHLPPLIFSVGPHTKFTTYPPEFLRHQILTVSASVLLPSSMAIASNVMVAR